jgi:beta-carotene hydroxylase
MSKMQTPSPDHRALKAATQQMGSLAWPTILLGVSCIAGFVSAPLMVVQGLISLWLAVIVIALVTYASYTVMHDAVHGAIVGRNRSLLWLKNL